MSVVEKRGIWQGQLVWWILGLIVLILSLLLYGIITGKFESYVSYLKDVFRFGR